jgi:hypothetical protein
MADIAKLQFRYRVERYKARTVFHISIHPHADNTSSAVVKFCKSRPEYTDEIKRAMTDAEIARLCKVSEDMASTVYRMLVPGLEIVSANQAEIGYYIRGEQ